MSATLVIAALAAAVVLAVGGTGIGRPSPAGRSHRWGPWGGSGGSGGSGGTHRSGRSDPALAGGRRAPGTVSPPSAAAVLVAVGGLALALVVVLGPGLAILVAALVGVARAASVAIARRRRQRRIDDALPDLIDLLVIAAAAGHPVARCVDVVAGRAPAPLRATLEGVRSRVALGVPLVDSLRQAAPELGPLGGPLTAALADGQATGAPLAATLGQLAATARDARRRRAEESARRLPVTLLFPLVCCILPAFALLAVVPLLMASLGSLER